MATIAPPVRPVEGNGQHDVAKDAEKGKGAWAPVAKKGISFLEGRMPTSMGRQVGGDHYRRLAIEPTVYSHMNGLDTCEANVVKYVSRHKFKGGRKDIEKAIHYLEMLLTLAYPEDEDEEEKS